MMPDGSAFFAEKIILASWDFVHVGKAEQKVKEKIAKDK